MASAPNLDLFASDAIADPYPLYSRLREHAPIHQVPGTTFYLVSTADLVEEAVGRTDDFSSNLRAILVLGPDGRPGRFAMDLGGAIEQVLATADGSAHRAHRKFVLHALAKRIRVLETAADEIAAQLWADHAHEGRIDWGAAVANRLPPAILAKLLGMPDEEVPQLLTAAYESVELLGGLATPQRMEQLVSATFGLHDYLERTLNATDPGADGLFGVLATALDRGDIELGTATMILMQLVGAGAETTAGLIGTAARYLAQDPGLQDALRADAALIDPFLEECLRLDPPLRGHYRVATSDTELGGVTIPIGSHLLLLWSSANRDATRYDNPDRIDLARPGIRQHLAFGKGTHFCVGSSLARLEATAAVRTLLSNTNTFALNPNTPPVWVKSVVVRRAESLPLTFNK